MKCIRQTKSESKIYIRHPYVWKLFIFYHLFTSIAKSFSPNHYGYDQYKKNLIQTYDNGMNMHVLYIVHTVHVPLEIVSGIEKVTVWSKACLDSFIKLSKSLLFRTVWWPSLKRQIIWIYTKAVFAVYTV